MSIVSLTELVIFSLGFSWVESRTDSVYFPLKSPAKSYTRLATQHLYQYKQLLEWLLAMTVSKL